MAVTLVVMTATVPDAQPPLAAAIVVGKELAEGSVDALTARLTPLARVVHSAGEDADSFGQVLITTGRSAGPEDLVAVVDAGCPLVTVGLVQRMVAAVEGDRAAIATGAVTDTVRHDDGSPLDRAEVVEVLSPLVGRAATFGAVAADLDGASVEAVLRGLHRVGLVVRAVTADSSGARVTDSASLALARARVGP